MAEMIDRLNIIQKMPFFSLKSLILRTSEEGNIDRTWFS